MIVGIPLLVIAVVASNTPRLLTITAAPALRARAMKVPYGPRGSMELANKSSHTYHVLRSRWLPSREQKGGSDVKEEKEEV